MLKKNGEGLEQNKNQFCDFVYEYLKSLVPKINQGKNIKKIEDNEEIHKNENKKEYDKERNKK